MKTNILTILFLLAQISLFAQETVTTTNKYGIENQELLQLFEFQNITVEKFIFESLEINGKYYKVQLKEFENGELVNTKTLFDGTGIEFLKIKNTGLSFKIFTHITEKNLKIQLKKSEYSGPALNLELTENKSGYVMKDFFGAKIAVENPLNQEFPLLAIITPTENEDGSASYCEVVQSDIKPEKLGEHFKIPHYFLITMEFK